jgi:hypothetical protein
MPVSFSFENYGKLQKVIHNKDAFDQGEISG